MTGETQTAPPHGAASGGTAERPVFELFEGFALTSVLASLERSGLLARLEGGGVPADLGAGEGPEDLPLATLRYLAQRGLVEERDGSYALSERGRAICRDKGYLVWLAGGYGEALAELGAFTTGTKRYGTDVIRDGRWVADGSALIGRVDVNPHATELLDGISFDHAVDLGCGTARFLISAAQRYGASGFGVDLAPEACEDAEVAIAAAGLGGKVRVRCANAADIDAIPELGEAQLVVAFFLLHEIFEQGRDALLAYLERLAELTPAGAHLLIAEVQPASGALDERWRPEFTLLHAIMRQQLMTAEAWDEVLTEAGWERRVVRDVDLPGAVLLLYANGGTR